MTTEIPCAVDAVDSFFSYEERSFDPWRVPKTPAGETFVADVAAMIQEHEAQLGLRSRKRKLADQLVFDRMVIAVVSDLAINVLCEDSNGIHLSRSHRHLGQVSRYKAPATSKTLRRLLDQMAHPLTSLIQQELGYRAKGGPTVQTVARPTARLQRMIRIRGLTPTDFGELLRPEPIELKSAPISRTKRGQLIDYPETHLTAAFRAEMQEINGFLSQAGICYNGPQSVDVNKRQLRRSFTRGDFESGGRLFGGFWQQMKKRDRLRYIRIEGQDTVELDYGQVMPRLVYALSGVVPVMEDLYDIPGFKQHRSGIKKVTSSMLFVWAPLSRFPKETRHLFPNDMKIGDVTSAIMAAHPDISNAFFTGIGHRCQFLESQILVGVLTDLLGKGITALPIHDAIIVPASAVVTAKQVMLDTFKRRTGQEGVVDIITKHQLEEQEEELQLVA